MDEKLDISTDWTFLRGKDLYEAVATKYDKEFNETERPDIDDIVSFEQSVHLQQPPTNTTNPIEFNDDLNNSVNIKKGPKHACEILFKLKNYKFKSISLVSDCQTLELFINPLHEYYKTYFGEFIDDFDGIRVYRFDIDITKSSSYLLVKFISPEPEIWIYGILVNINTTSNNIESAINLEDLKQILPTISSHQSNQDAKAMFFQNLLNLSMKSSFPVKPSIENLSRLSIVPETSVHKNENKIFNSEDIKEYIDRRMMDMETRILAKLENLETKQNEKLDKIFNILNSLPLSIKD